MPKYIVVDGHKKIGGKLRAPGDEVDCSEETALQLRLQPAREEKPAMTAAEVIARIQGCKTAGDVDKLIAGDTRKTVLDAADKAKKDLEANK